MSSKRKRRHRYMILILHPLLGRPCMAPRLLPGSLVRVTPLGFHPRRFPPRVPHPQHRHPHRACIALAQGGW
ncbi:hypothetical protein F5B21DRAFT_465747 [Xylaria acuta]|nr:hypothetical protein F5B21DRAFT_465747 [Xylaria acuta]